MKKCIFPGSFDPPTNGHLLIVEKSAMMFDEVVVAIGCNPKKNSTFSLADRLLMLQLATKPYSNVAVKSYNGLLFDFVEQEGAGCIVRGARGECEIKEDEKQFNLAFKDNHDIQLMFFSSPKSLEKVSSSYVKKLLKEGKSVNNYIPREVLEVINKKV